MGLIALRERDLQRIEVLSKVVEGRMTIVSAAQVCAEFAAGSPVAGTVSNRRRGRNSADLSVLNFVDGFQIVRTQSEIRGASPNQW